MKPRLIVTALGTGLLLIGCSGTSSPTATTTQALSAAHSDGGHRSGGGRHHGRGAHDGADDLGDDDGGDLGDDDGGDLGDDDGGH
jgi:hypothetical protein